MQYIKMSKRPVVLKYRMTGYQDVLYMLIYYSISSFELLERRLSNEEKDEIVKTFARIGHANARPGYSHLITMNGKVLMNIR